MKKIAFLLMWLIAPFTLKPVLAQPEIKGKVTDTNTKEPLELAVIFSKNNEVKLTDRNGYFVLQHISAGDSLTVSYIGYQTKTVAVPESGKLFVIPLEKGPVDLKEIIINNESNNLTHAHNLSYIDLNTMPVKSAQDLLRLVPGLFTAQHQGGGKAEQIFLRGFDADHGTDVALSVDGVPVNLVSQAHGQGYADLHFLIPETVKGYDFGKGPYYTPKGDFCTAGYVDYSTKNVLDNNLFKVEAGQFSTIRAVTMLNLLSKKATNRGQSAYVAGEGLYTNGGPYDVPEHFYRINIFGKFITNIGTRNKLMMSLSTLASKWRAAGEIPNRAEAEGYIKDPFGSIDSSQGGYVTRSNANIKLTSGLGNNLTWENQAYFSRYYFNLVSNFTFFYVNPVTGDEFAQHEVRDMFGYNSRITRNNYFGNAVLTSVASAGFRNDATLPSWLSHTENGQFLNYIQKGNIRETNANSFIDETLTAGNWLFNAGARFDYFNFYYNNTAPVSDTAANIYNGLQKSNNAAIISPKLNIQYTVNKVLQLYVKTGKGFHSNDARVVIANKGYEILPAAYGADLGMNWKPFPGLYINAALWYLFLQQEFVYGADYGDESVQPGGKTVRKGIDLSARYQINKWLYSFVNIDLARPEELDKPKGNNYLPLAPTFTSTGGLYLDFKNGFNGSISYRYMHNRAANENYSLTAKGYFITDVSANYTTKKYEIGLGIENLFNQSWNEAQFEYVTRLKYETQAVDEVSNTPGVPFFARLKLSVFF